MPSVLSTPPFSGRRPPFRLAEPSHSFGRPRLLRSPPSARNRHALTGRAVHGSPPRRPQTPAGDPPLAARPFLLPSPSPPSARPPLLLQPAFSRSRHTLTGRAAHGSPPRRPQTPAGDPPLAAAYLFLLPEPRPSARPLLLPPPAVCWSHHTLTGERGPWSAAATPSNARQRPRLWPPPTFSSCRSRVLPHGPCSCRRPPFPLAGTARPFGQPRGRQIFHAGAGFCPYMQGFARACGILLI